MVADAPPPRSLAHCAIDWDATIASVRHLWVLGLGVAEAMDTAQRGMGLDWPTSLELIGRSRRAATAWEARNGRALILWAAAPITWMPERSSPSTTSSPATKSRWRAIEAVGGQLIVMASRALARIAESAPTTSASTAAC